MAFLYGELHILHIMIVLLQLVLDIIELSKNLWHILLHRRIFCGASFLVNALEFCPTYRTFLSNLLWCTDTGNHVLALCIDKILTIEEILTCCCITAEANSCCGCIAHITEYHGHNRYSCTPLCRNAFHLAIEDGTLVHPTVEYGTDSAPKLIHRIVGEVLACLLLDGCLECLDELLQFFDCHFVVESNSALLLHVHDNSLEWIDVFLVDRLHAKHNIAIHLYETTIAVVSEALIACLASQSLYYLVVQTKVEDSIHHAWHRSTGTRTNTDKKRILHVTELRVHQSLNMLNRLLYFFFEKGYNVFLAFFKVFITNIGCDSKTWRNGDTNKIHLCQVGSLTTKQVSHVGLAFRLTITKGINSFYTHS